MDGTRQPATKLAWHRTARNAAREAAHMKGAATRERQRDSNKFSGETK